MTQRQLDELLAMTAQEIEEEIVTGIEASKRK
jgi:hypothetical protein